MVSYDQTIKLSNFPSRVGLTTSQPPYQPSIPTLHTNHTNVTDHRSRLLESGSHRTRQRCSGPVCDRPSGGRRRLEVVTTGRNGPGRARTVANRAGAALTGAVRTGLYRPEIADPAGGGHGASTARPAGGHLLAAQRCRSSSSGGEREALQSAVYAVRHRPAAAAAIPANGWRRSALMIIGLYGAV